jgi:uncharacterized coiled-coil DUF342 family protein
MVGLGDTKKKIEKMISAAEELYEKMNQLRAEIDDLRAKVEKTSEQVDTMEHDLDEQRVLIERIAREQGIDVDEVLAEAVIEEVDAGNSAETSGAAGGSAAEPED